MVEVKRARTLPAWASVLIILAAIAGAVYCVRWFIVKGPGGAEVVVLDRGPEDGVKTLLANRRWRVQSGNNGLKISKDADGGFRQSFYYVHYDFLAPADFEVLSNARRIVADGAVASAIGLSDAQVEQVRAQVDRGFVLELPEADRQRIATLFSDYLAAGESARASKESALLRALDDVGDRLIPSAHHATVDAVTRLKSLITPDQWKKFEAM